MTQEEMVKRQESILLDLKEEIERLENELRAATEKGAVQWQEAKDWLFLTEPNFIGNETAPALQTMAVNGQTEAKFYRVARTAIVGFVDGWGWGMSDLPEGLDEVIAVSAGPRYRGVHSLALRVDGTVVSWGDNSYGQTDVPVGLNNVASIAAGGRHSLVAKHDGTVEVWGDDSLGQITEQPENLSGVIDVKAGLWHSMALKEDGTVVAWGDLFNGPDSVPTGLEKVIAIAAGPRHCLALKSDHTVVAWGFDYDFLSGYLPIDVPTDLNDVVEISAGIDNNLARLVDGTVVAWGKPGSQGAAVPDGLEGIFAASVGWHFGVALKEDGEVVQWGQTSGASGLDHLVAVSAGGLHVVGVRTNADSPVIRRQPKNTESPVGLEAQLTVVATSTLPISYQWQKEGVDLFGETSSILTFASLQDEDNGFYRVRVSTAVKEIWSRTVSLSAVHAPVILEQTPAELALHQPQGSSGVDLSVTVLSQGTDKLSYQWLKNDHPFGLNIGTFFRVHFASADWEGAYRVRVSNIAGSVLSEPWTVKVTLQGESTGWGDNTYGQLNSNREETNIVHISAGMFHTLGLREDGSVTAWGYNESEQTDVPAELANVIAIAAGAAHSLALREDGMVLGWGWNDYGQTTAPPNETGIAGIAAGFYHTLAVRRDGTVTGWGDNSRGALDFPTDLEAVKKVAAGDGISYALLSNGTVRAWGTGSSGSGSVTVPPGLNDAVEIAAANSHALVLRENGTVLGLGVDSGWGETAPPGSLTDVIQVSAGYQFSLALRNDGSIAAWGRSDVGQTLVPSGLGDTKMVAAGGSHAQALAYSSILMYPIDVTRDLLVIYNMNLQESVDVKDYYLARRPNVSEAITLGIGGASTVLEDYTNFDEATNTLIIPILDWLDNHPTKRPSHYVLCYGIPNRTWKPGNSPDDALFSNAHAIRAAVAGRKPLITSINMASKEDCLKYIDKLDTMGSLQPPGRIYLSAQAAGLGPTTYVLDNVRYSGLVGMKSASNQRDARQTLINLGVPMEDIHYSDNWAGISYSDDWPYNPYHIRDADDVSAYTCWGQHGGWPEDWPTAIFDPDMQPYISFHGNSGWFIMQSYESWNGRWFEFSSIPNQSSYELWFSENAFGGANYANTPVGAVSHVREPGLDGANITSLYFGLWQVGKSFAIAAWGSARTHYMQATGDPFVKR